jgi:hypothetical protein
MFVTPSVLNLLLILDFVDTFFSLCIKIYIYVQIHTKRNVYGKVKMTSNLKWRVTINFPSRAIISRHERHAYLSLQALSRLKLPQKLLISYSWSSLVVVETRSNERATVLVWE